MSIDETTGPEVKNAAGGPGDTARTEGESDVTWTPDQVREVLRGVFDPDLHMSIVDLGLVYGIDVSGGTVTVKMTLTSPACPYGPYLLHQVKQAILSLRGIGKADVQVVWEPPWGPPMMSEEARLQLGFDL
jgi:metal-sulfur cluster biosynthetic enzyme